MWNRLRVNPAPQAERARSRSAMISSLPQVYRPYVGSNVARRASDGRRRTRRWVSASNRAAASCDRPARGVHAERARQPGHPDQGLEPYPDREAGIVGEESLLDAQFLGVVRPALDEGA